MGMRTRALGSVVGVGLVATAAVVVGGASLSPASAACAGGWRWTAGNIANSEPSYASHECAGLVAHQTVVRIRIQGWYNNGSGWSESSLSEKWVDPGVWDNKAVVGETMDGVTLKGERVDGSNSDVYYSF